MTDDKYFIWSPKHRGLFWKKHHSGYTTDLSEAAVEPIEFFQKKNYMILTVSSLKAVFAEMHSRLEQRIDISLEHKNLGVPSGSYLMLDQVIRFSLEHFQTPINSFSPVFMFSVLRSGREIKIIDADCIFKNMFEEIDTLPEEGSGIPKEDGHYLIQAAITATERSWTSDGLAFLKPKQISVIYSERL